MITQYNTVCKFIFIISFFNISRFHSRQLALPNQNFTTLSGHNNISNEFSADCKDYLFLSSTIASIITSLVLLINVIGKFLLNGCITLSIISNIWLLNFQFRFPGLIKCGKVFYFN